MPKRNASIAIIAVGLLITTWSLFRFFAGSDAEEPLRPALDLAEEVANGETIEIRVHAARQLARHGRSAQPEIRRTFAQARTRGEPEVLVPVIAAVGESHDWKEIPNLVELMRHEDPRIRGRAGAVAQKLIGADYGFRAHLPLKERNEAIAMIEAALPVMQTRLQEFYNN